MAVEVLIALGCWSSLDYKKELKEMGIEPSMEWDEAKAQADIISAECRARCGKWYKKHIRGQHDKFRKAV